MLNMNQNLKTIVGFVLLSLGMVVSLIAQANLPVPPLPPEGQANIFTAMYDTVLHNPSSLLVVIILCVAAWLMDELPFINSKYVTHFTTLIGGSIYWMFCHPANVPKTFPYAWPVLACIGVICGFVAGVLHRQIIGRLIEYVKGRIPGSDPKPVDSNPPPPSATRLPLLLCVLGASVAILSGCGTTTTQAPPSPTEQKYFEIQTNYVPVVVLVTNKTEATATTPASIQVETVTNQVAQYTFTPNENAGAVAGTGGLIGNFWGVGAPVGAGLAGLFSLWGLWRSRKSAVATSAELAQIIETGRQMLLTLPEGAKYEAAYKDWMIKHQAQTQTIAAVSQLVAGSVNNAAAKGAAQTIVNLIQAQPK
jgi:hypothetical protein